MAMIWAMNIFLKFYSGQNEFYGTEFHNIWGGKKSFRKIPFFFFQLKKTKTHIVVFPPLVIFEKV